jgi:hypothetical protein
MKFSTDAARTVALALCDIDQEDSLKSGEGTIAYARRCIVAYACASEVDSRRSTA